MIEKKDVKKFADLVRIRLSDGEIEKLQGEMAKILDYISEIKKVSPSVSGSSFLNKINAAREDGSPHKPGLYTDEILGEAPSVEKGYIKVKKIL